MAQGDKQMFPREPLLSNAPETAAWTVIYQYPPSATHEEKKNLTHPKGHITSVEIEKTRDVYHKVTHFDTGNQSEMWSVKGRELIKENSSSPFVPTPPDGPIADDYSKSDFEDLDWLNMKYYAGMEKGEHPGFVFRAKYKDRIHTRREKMADAVYSLRGAKKLLAQIDAPEGDESASVSDQQPDSESTIILDANTQLPVAYDQGIVKRSYKFLPPPTSPIIPHLRSVPSWHNGTLLSKHRGRQLHLRR